MRAKIRPHMMVLFLTLWAPLVKAQDVPTQNEERTNVDYSVFSLEELFKVNVVTASKQEEPLWDAGGVVTVLNRQEIDQFGANNLWDLVERFPSVQKNYSSGVYSTSIRGGEGISQHHLLVLIDGRPFRSSNGNSSTYAAWSTFPTEIIERIEIVRGPGSVLYGTNAFEGVFNVITKKKRDTETQVNVKRGSFNTTNMNLASHYKKGDFSIDLGLYALETDGWDFTSAYRSGTGPNGELTFSDGVYEDTLGYKVNINYKNWNATVYQGKMEHFAEVFFNNDTVYYTSDVQMYNLSYENQISENWKLEINATNNLEFFDWRWDRPEYNGEPVISVRADDVLIEGTAYGKITEGLRLIFGVVGQEWSGKNPPAVFSRSEVRYNPEQHIGAYTEINYRINRYLKFIAGAQLNKPEEKSSDLVPRIGTIWNISPRTGIKFLYGKAFKSPIPQEREINTTSQLGFPGLESEKITTISAQLFYQGNREMIIFTAFKSNQKNLIRSLPPTEEDFEFFKPYYPTMTLDRFLSYDLILKNRGELRVKGVELESKLTLGENWFVTAAFSQQENENDLGIKNVTLAPKKLLKAGVAYSLQFFSVGALYLYYDKTPDNILISPGRVLLNPTETGINSLGINSEYKWKFKQKDFTFQLYGRNLLDRDVWVHQLPLDEVNTISGEGQRSFFASLKVKI